MPEDPIDKLGEIPPGQAALLTHGAYEDIKDAIRASKPVAGIALKSRQTDDGIVLDVDPAALGDHPFKVTSVVDGDDCTASVSGGTFNGDVSPRQEISIAGGSTGTFYIIGKPVFTLSVSFSFVYGWSYGSFSLDSTSLDPPGNVLSTTGDDFRIPIAKIVDGVVVEQYVMLDLAADLRDDGGGTGQAFMKYTG